LTRRTSKTVQKLLDERVHCAIVIGKTNQGQNRLFAIGGLGANGQPLRSIESIDVSLGEEGQWER